jgi:lipoprotein-releasing system ATP-binding protein
MSELIRVRELKKTYQTPGGAVEVLKGISFDIKKAEMIAIVGPSGAGKSTLLHILGALDKPTLGTVHYGDRDIFSLKNEGLAHFRNKTVGFVFQFHHLLPEFSALENIMMPAFIAGITESDIRPQALKILSDMGLSERITHKPGKLSGGEQQRVATARALVLEPSVILADEPTGNLDTHTGNELFEIFKSLNKKGITFVIVTHNEDIASQCGRIIQIIDGKIVHEKRGKNYLPS